MTKKELSQLYYLKKEIKEQQRRLAELEAVAINCSTKITGLPTGKGISDKIGNYAAQIADLKADDLKKAALIESNDYEDALQMVCANRIKADFIITRNIRDFINSKTLAIKPSELLERI